MAQTATFRQEDSAGLVVAIALHACVVALLLMQPARDAVLEIPERMTVSLSSEVSLESTAPDPVPESRAAIAPTLSADPAPAPASEPAQTTAPPAQPQPRIQPRTPPRTEPAPTPRATTAPTATRRTTPPARERTRPDRATSPARTAPAQAPSRPPAKAASTGGGSRIGDDFLPGAGSSTRTEETRVPASAIGASARASLQQAINRQIKPHWSAPQGADAEKLISVVSWQLNSDGSLRGAPRCSNDSSSITDSNRPQASLHCERAIRAVQLAAPFDLPDEYYEAWKNITSWRFDRRL